MAPDAGRSEVFGGVSLRLAFAPAALRWNCPRPPVQGSVMATLEKKEKRKGPASGSTAPEVLQTWSSRRYVQI
eukprot:172498-Prymnesium_polylepis.1